MQLLRFNQEPLQIPSERLIGVIPDGPLIGVQYLLDNGETTYVVGYYLQNC